MTIDAIREDFSFLDDWEDRYRYIIELGRALPPFDEAQRLDANKVRGCASQVWLATDVDDSGNTNDPILKFTGTSDALIVSGLIAILLAIYSNKTASQIQAINAQDIFADLGLKDHLSPQRANGLVAMVNRIHRDAKFAADK